MSDRVRATTPPPIDSPETRAKLYTAFRSYFDMAERKRRWNVTNDIPWDQCNPDLDPAIADVVKTFCMVELYLPDYLAKLIPQVRANHGRAWMLANWGYEESKHSMVLGDWLLKSKAMTDSQMMSMEDEVFTKEWELPYDNARAMVIYTMMQELATQIHYRNLRKVVNGRCPALDTVLELVAIDEAAHAQFFRQLVAIYLEDDREATLEQFLRVLNTFTMPALHLISEGAQRVADVRALNIFSEQTFTEEVYHPLMNRLGLTRADLRQKGKQFRTA
jgi:acyl-[acyl-carrier-protein] desaturase